MTERRGTDWNPGAYARFRGLRLRPALDLLSHVGDIPEGAMVDLGCGDGAAGPILKARWPDRQLLGIDASPAMCAAARAAGFHDRVDEADIAVWMPDGPVALIFSNAALHWVADHAQLLPRLIGSLEPSGTLAVQMPRQSQAPSHRLLREIAADLFPDRFDLEGWQAPVGDPQGYLRMVAPLGAADVWETIYLQRLATEGAGHPVRRFTESTVMRPFLNEMAPAEAAEFVRRYEAALSAVYAREADGGVLFPFRRLFLTVRT